MIVEDEKSRREKRIVADNEEAQEPANNVESKSDPSVHFQEG